MRIDKEDSAIDLGCGEGSITIPLAKIASKVTAIDSSSKMLEILANRCEKENINNVTIVKKDLEDITVDDVGKHDIVLASRSINGIYPIKETLANMNEIANKYVYITLFGPNNWKFEHDFYDSIGKEYSEFASYSYLFNILIGMGIHPNIENLEIKTNRTYETVYDAMENGKWNLNDFTDNEKTQLRSYLKEKLEKNKDGKLENPDDKADWVLIWWKKANRE
jgi:ubiquinone/menaquinone biosynthesis C-methylase UbiE